MNKIDEEIKQYFAEQEVVQLPEHEHERLRKLVRLNEKRTNYSVFKRVTLVACSICLLLLAIIPTIVLLYDEETPPPTLYYGVADATRVELNEQEARDIISSGYAKYEFIFDEFSFNSAVAYYSPDEADKLLSLKIKVDEIVEENMSCTSIEINLVASQQFIFSNKDAYLTDSEYSTTEDYELYKSVTNTPLKKYIKGYFIYPNYELYLALDKINEEVFNKFI